VDESFRTVQNGLWPNSKLLVSSLLPLVSDRLEVSRIWSPTTNNYRKIQLRVGGTHSNWPHIITTCNYTIIHSVYWQCRSFLPHQN
jgi:hypothetical protein